MSAIPLLFLLAVVPAIYSAFIKLSANILRYRDITWKQGAIFGFIVILYSLLVRGVPLLFRFSMPLALSMAIGFLGNLLIGVWFFSKRGTTAAGSVLGWKGALQLTGFALILLVFTGATISMLPKWLMAATMP